MANLWWNLALLGFAPVACAQAVQTTTALPLQLGSRFESKLADANGTQLHYIRGGVALPLSCCTDFPKTGTSFV